MGREELADSSRPGSQVVVLAESLCLRLPGQPELCAAIMAHVVEGDAAREEGAHR
jgi:hypothetical protein